VPVQEVDLDVGELAERARDHLQSRARDRGRRPRLGLDHSLPGVGHAGGREDRLRFGEQGVDDDGIMAAAAPGRERPDCSLPVARARDRHEILGDLYEWAIWGAADDASSRSISCTDHFRVL
jgi:hypothetical protein